MRNAFLVAILLGIVSGCAAPKIYELNSTTWMVTYKYATSYDIAPVDSCVGYGAVVFE